MHTRPFLLAMGGLLLSAALAGPVRAQPPAAAHDPEALLELADGIKTTDNARFVRLLDQLDQGASRLPTEQLWYLRYLQAWEAAWIGDYPKATTLAMAVADQAGDITLRARAGATSVNMLGLGHRYTEAFVRLDQLLRLLPGVTDRQARYQVESEAAQLYGGTGQYDLAADYANRMTKELSSAAAQCKANYFVLHAAYHLGKLAAPEQDFRAGIERCTKTGERLFANVIRGDLAEYYLSQGRAGDTIRLLEANYQGVKLDRYRDLISQFDAQLAQAYDLAGNTGRARQYALAALESSISGEYTRPLVDAYRLLYRIEQKAGHYQAALAFLEKYMAADKAYLDDVSAKALAYQMVKQEVRAKKADFDALARKNQILQLQQALDRKAVEASRLYIAVLALGLLVIGLWLLRLKRSQLQFMRMAQCDSLTGIYNRKHFMSEAEHALYHAARSARSGCLLLIDLDHFKLTNDTYGHAMGDQVLRRAVMACQEFVRPSDVFGRLGGEEFGVLLPDCGLDSGIERAESIRRAIAALSEREDPGIPVSASFGVAWTDESGYDLRQLLMDADHALYRAKRAGRNCVVAGKQGEGVVVA
ncbi:GGDEF domain-containing protein [Frateuria terrea]|uniref:diguanylate cyclase n=1 Tax=Frateuria terrea TaxID=529704 RepID=A0A1H6QFR0_9GAMM|nr:GGDEF domain-containing protein [Frateuria terrea]SEI42533.1 diguanylate cyclase (GGDEF) domain-containing protein [Frateuria terrea]SFP07799.1 diguanylate cyclase (GGDEF) domain-containing protein [Frateuria terrea]